jgi:DNA polymerase-3 subunit delta'
MIRWGIGADKAQLLSHLAAGRLGWAVQASHNDTILAERQQQLSHLRNALESNRVRRLALAGKLARKPESLPLLLKTWLSWWHDLTLLAYHGDSFVPAVPISNIDQKNQLAEYAHEWDRERILSGFKQTGQAIWQLERNGNIRLVLENLFLSYPLSDKTN